MSDQTKDQIASIMLQYGTPVQQAEALDYCREFSPVTISDADLDAVPKCSSCEQLRAEVERLTKLHASGRYNIEDTEDGIKICRGLHDNGTPCDYEYFVKRTFVGAGTGRTTKWYKTDEG